MSNEQDNVCFIGNRREETIDKTKRCDPHKETKTKKRTKIMEKKEKKNRKTRQHRKKKSTVIRHFCDKF